MWNLISGHPEIRSLIQSNDAKDYLLPSIRNYRWGEEGLASTAVAKLNQFFLDFEEYGKETFWCIFHFN